MRSSSYSGHGRTFIESRDVFYARICTCCFGVDSKMFTLSHERNPRCEPTVHIQYGLGYIQAIYSCMYLNYTPLRRFDTFNYSSNQNLMSNFNANCVLMSRRSGAINNNEIHFRSQEKLRKRIHFHGNNRESLYAHVESKMLPKLYGGALNYETDVASQSFWKYLTIFNDDFIGACYSVT